MAALRWQGEGPGDELGENDQGREYDYYALAVSADLQYMKDDLGNALSAEGFLFGQRATALF